MATDAARDSSKAGLVIAAHGRRGILETADGSALPYVVRGRQLQVCCGDLAHWQAFSAGDPVVVNGIAPRRNQLSRQPARGSKPETIAANISHLIVVMAALPAPDLFITDRYLCAARLMGAEAAIAWNKADLAALPEAELAAYAAIGYPLFPVSAVTGCGLEALLELVRQWRQPARRPVGCGQVLAAEPRWFRAPIPPPAGFRLPATKAGTRPPHRSCTRWRAVVA